MLAKNNILKILSLALLFAFGAVSAQAQGVPQQKKSQAVNNFSDEDLKKYAKVSAKAEELTSDAQNKMLTMISEKENLNVKKFNELMQAQQNPNMNVEATAEERADFEELAPKLNQIQQDLQTQVMATLEKEGLAPQKFQSIAIASQQDPALQARVDRMSAK